MNRVCSSFQRVARAERPHVGKEFFPSGPEQSGVLQIHDSGHDSCSGLLLFPEQCAVARWRQSQVNNLPLNKQRGRGGRRMNCSPTVQWTAGRQPRVFSTHVHLTHSSDPAGFSWGREQTFVLNFLCMVEHSERSVWFSDLNKLSHSKPNNQISQLHQDSGGTSGKITWFPTRTVSQPTALKTCQGCHTAFWIWPKFLFDFHSCIVHLPAL